MAATCTGTCKPRCRACKLARSRDYQRRNKHKRWERLYRARCREYGLPIRLTPFTRQDVIDRYGDKCAYCKSAPFEQIDHAIPVIEGGAHDLENARPCCEKCNGRKERRRIQDLRLAELQDIARKYDELGLENHDPDA